MKIIITIALFLCANLVKAQSSFDGLIKALKNHKLSKFEKVLKDSGRKDIFSAGPPWVYREVVNGYHEIVYEIYKGGHYIDPLKQDTFSVPRPYAATLQILVKRNKIISHKLTLKKYYRVKRSKVEFEVLADSFRNSKQWVKYENEFSNIFYAKPLEEDFCLPYFSYGYICGMEMGETPGSRIINRLVSQQNKDSLFIWLKSANPEKRMYALRGLYELKKKGLKLTSGEYKLINIVKQDKAEIMTCSMCDGRQKKLSEVASEMNFAESIPSPEINANTVNQN